MPRLRAILLDMQGGSLNFALWADTPSGVEGFYANPDAVSAWKDASLLDNIEIRDGRVVERVGRLALNSPPPSKAQVRADIEKLWQRHQNEISSADHYRVYGTVWDGASWSEGGV